MFRTALFLALSSLALPALAADPGFSFDSDDAVAFAPDAKSRRGKDDLPERTGPRDLGDEPVEEFDLLDDEAEFDEPDFLGDVSDDSDLSIDLIDLGEAPPATRKQASAPATAKPKPISLEVLGKDPLADNYPVQIVAVDRDAVVIELPVLAAQSRALVDAGFILIAELYADDDLVGKVEHRLDQNSFAEFGPTFTFFRMMAPVLETEGQITIKISKSALDGTGATELFTRATPYSL